MSVYLLPGILGLLVGLLLHWAGFSRQEGLRRALGLRRSMVLRSGLTAVGWSMAVTALLCYLAVIDVDTIRVLPLSIGVLAGGALLGIAAGLCGFTPTTAFAGLGADTALEALSVLAGCTLIALLLPGLADVFAPLQTPISAATLFRVTLDEPFLLDGGFLGQGCAGLLLVTIAICIPSPRPVIVQETPAEPVQEAPESEQIPAEASAEADPIPDPEAAPEETFVALLPGEEPLVVDTELDEEERVPEEAEVSDVPEENDVPEEIGDPEED